MALESVRYGASVYKTLATNGTFHAKIDWEGPVSYTHLGDGGSKNYLIASLDQSLKRMGTDYVDIYYHHCPDPETPVEESMEALAQIVKQGKALYVGISSYSPEDTLKAYDLLRERGVRLLVHQANYSMLNRYIEKGLTTVFQKIGIGCTAYCPLAQGMLTDRYQNGCLLYTSNHRDHRKICIIDGNVGFTGGINLADEYINEYPRFGYWKDTAVMLRGAAVWSMTVAFMSMWYFAGGEIMRFSEYRPTLFPQGDGFVQPYGDSPLDNLNISENVYLNIISRAEKYVYITTPYLILDNELLTALCMAANGGIDVRIITPHIADKWYVHLVTQSNYKILVDAGVKIYEYTPGFIHAKMFVCDDKIAVVGSANLDYRSLYLHFEFCTVMMHAAVVEKVKKDIENILSLIHI